jgi:hypothetical protein
MNRINAGPVSLIVSIVMGSTAEVSRAADSCELWPSDSLTKVMRSATPGREPTVLEIAGARGEIVSAQAVFRTTKGLGSVTASLSDLRHAPSGNAIPAGSVRLQWVRYIDINRNSAIPTDELVAKAPASIPDPYWEDAAIAIKANHAQPLWIEFSIPRTAARGVYEGKLKVTGPGASAELPVKLTVWNFEMPRERHLSVVNWWNFPGLGFADRVKPYTEDYWQLLGRFCAFLVEHRQTDINTSIGLIEEAGSAEKGFSHNTRRLERYAEVAFAAGIRQIQLHSAGRATAGLTEQHSRIEPVEANLRRLAAFEGVIMRRGWQRRFAVSISDEPFIYHEETYAAVVDRVHKIAPSVRCIEAVETEYLGKLDIYVPKLSHLNLFFPRFDQVRHDGVELWFYTCCHPLGRYPNRFLDQPLVKARVLHWINYLYDMDGYLHWGLNHFYGNDPYTQEAISKDLPLGDRAIAYPGRNCLLGSLRFSAMRDGLQDFEYLWVLEQELRAIKQRTGKEAFWLDPRQRPLELCRRVVWSFHDHSRDPRMLLDTRRAIAEEIEALRTGPLLIVQTSPPEGTVVPAGPRLINVRGLVPPGAKVTVNGSEVKNVRPGGYFLLAHFMADGHPTITVQVDHDGRKRVTQRAFRLSD